MNDLHIHNLLDDSIIKKTVYYIFIAYEYIICIVIMTCDKIAETASLRYNLLNIMINQVWDYNNDMSYSKHRVRWTTGNHFISIFEKPTGNDQSGVGVYWNFEWPFFQIINHFAVCYRMMVGWLATLSLRPLWLKRIKVH